MRWFSAAIMAAVVAGCGGDDGLTRAELADQANAICTKYAQQGRDLGQPDLADAQIAEEYFAKAADLAREQQVELEALEPLEGAQADWAALTGATNKSIGVLDDLASAAAEEDDAERQRLVGQLPQLRVEVDEAARAVEADECAG